MIRFFVMLAAGVILSACAIGNDNAAEQSMASDEGPPPSPLLYEITGSAGAVEGWLFGTIHALPDDTKWRTEALETVTQDADFLIVEIADLDDTRGLAEIYSKLAASPNLLPLRRRVSKEKRVELSKLIRRSRFTERDFKAVETWAAALMLSQLVKSGDTDNGVDRAMIKEFANRPIREFEGAYKQLRIFDTLPAQDQLDLLDGVMRTISNGDNAPDTLRNAWVYGDEDILIAATKDGILADAELRHALLVKRNTNWAAQLDVILDDADAPLVAVGAAHLVGPDGLPALLEASGYTVSRIQ